MSDDFLNDLFDLGHDDIHHIDRTKYERAPFAMPGAKWRSLQEIIPRLPITKSSIWVDHFGGTGVVSWNVPECKSMVFNDRYAGIVAFYRCLRSKCAELITYLESMPPHSREEWIHCRQMWVNTTDDVERAAMWYYMTRLSVLNKRQAFGRGIQHRSIPLPESLSLFEPIAQKLKLFTLENLDVFTCIRDYDADNTIHYLDPPYLGTDQGTYKHKWNQDQQYELLQLIGRMKGFVALSHYPCEEIDNQSYWTNKYEWRVNVTAEPQVFKEENYKEGKEDVSSLENATECLWIKAASHG